MIYYALLTLIVSAAGCTAFGFLLAYSVSLISGGYLLGWAILCLLLATVGTAYQLTAAR